MMRYSLLLLCAALLAITPHQAMAQSLCPWVSAPTISGALHHPVKMHVVLLVMPPNLPFGSRPDAECEFSAPQTDSVVRVHVKTMQAIQEEYSRARSSCPSPIRTLIGVGNDAIACSLEKHGIITEQVVGRVRNRLFILRWNHPPLQPELKQETSTSNEMIVQMLAEQVAGAMY